MIDPHWQLVDLDPYTWRAIGKFIDPGMYIRAGSPDEHGLFVVHDGGRVLSVVETSGKSRRDLGLQSVPSPGDLAKELFDRGEWDRVHVIDRQHLARVSKQAQQLPNRDLELDAYYRNVFRLVWGEKDGYLSVPPHPGSWNGWTYSGIASFIGQFQDPASLALGVVDTDSGALEIGLIGNVSGGSFRKVTTFEALPFDRSEAAVSADFCDRVWLSLELQEFPPAAVMICTGQVFESWVYASHKSETIERAIDSGAAFVRLRDALGIAW